MTERSGSGTSRRALFAGAGAVGVAGVLAACGDDETPGAGAPTTTVKPTAAAKPPVVDEVIAKKSDIPVGGGKVFGENEVVITQPSAGKFVGLSAFCTHQQCILAKVEGDTIMCGCHGSQFSAKDGSVKKGPARQALSKVALKIEGDDIKLG